MTILLLLFYSPALALTADEPLAHAAQEMRAQEMFRSIRCVVCQSESIADSPAEVARDMRSDIRKRIASGQTNDAIASELSARYGDFILMSPPLNRTTALLWFGPVFILLAAIFCAIVYFRHPGAGQVRE